MANGMLYLDPDTVSAISSQMHRTADEIDSLKNSIVPQVQQVIHMGYSEWETRSLAWNAQESLDHFNYLASNNVDEIRTAAYQLAQVVETARANLSLLQRDSVTLDWGTIRTTSGAVSTVVGDASTVLGILEKLDKDLPKGINKLDESGALDAAGTVLDMLSQKDPRELFAAGVGDTAGTIVQGVLTDTPAGVVILTVEGIGLVSGLMATGQTYIANQYTGDVKSQLMTVANNLDATSKNADPGAVFKDAARTIYDGGADLTSCMVNGNWSGQHFANLGSDLSGIALALGGVVMSVPQFMVNSSAANFEDGLANLNQSVQNLPLPSSMKSGLNTVTVNTMKDINWLSNLVTTGQYNSQGATVQNTAKSLLKDAWNWF